MKLTNQVLIECGPHRVSSRSVSWNSNGSNLAMASSDRVARLWAIETSGAREVLVVSEHQAAVTKVRFHPTEASNLCTAAMDQTIRLWDVRQATQRAHGKIDLQSGKEPITVEWGGDSHHLAVTEEDGVIYVYDTRKLASSTQARGGRTSSSALKTFPMKPHIVEACQFSPDGNYLVTGSTVHREGMAELRIWPWNVQGDNESAVDSYPAHSGPIYTSQFSPDGRRLATGGADAIVGLWDVATMCCTHAIARRTKFIRSVAFSHDCKLVASSSEDDGIDLADSVDGSLVGVINLGSRPRSGGAEEVAWHPKEYLLACARTMPPMGIPPSPVTVTRLTIGSSQ